MLTQEQLVAIIFFLSVPFGLLGWARPYGMRFEKFFFGVLLHSMLHSSKRYFRSDDTIALISGQSSPDRKQNGQAPDNRKEKRKHTKTMDGSDWKKAQKKYRKKTYV